MLFFLYFAPSLSFPPASISLTVHSASHRTPQHIFGLFSGQFSPTLLILHPPSMPRPYLSLSLFTPPVPSFVRSPLRHIYVHISFWLSLLIVWPRFLIRYDGKSIPRPSTFFRPRFAPSDRLHNLRAFATRHSTGPRSSCHPCGLREWRSVPRSSCLQRRRSSMWPPHPRRLSLPGSDDGPTGTQAHLPTHRRPTTHAQMPI